MTPIEHERSRSDLGRANRRAVLSEIITGSPTSRTEIAQRTGLTTASISRITRKMIDVGLVREIEGPMDRSGQQQQRPGRRHIGLDINPVGGYVVGISIHAFQQFVSLADLRNRTIDRRELKIQSFADPEAVLSNVAETVEQTLTDSGISRSRVFGVSVAITGAIDPQEGLVRASPALGWIQVPVARMLQQSLSLPVHVESLPNAMNLAETGFGIARDYKNVVTFNAALAIGVSFYLDGRLIRGRDGSAGLFGLSYSAPADSQNPKSGGLAVMERAAGWAILSALGEPAMPEDPGWPAWDSAHRVLALMDRASNGDEKTQKIFYEAGQALGATINLIVALLHPEAILVSGPLSRSGDYMAGIKAATDENSALGSASVELLKSEITGQAAARWLAIDEFLIRRPLDLSKLDKGEAA